MRRTILLIKISRAGIIKRINYFPVSNFFSYRSIPRGLYGKHY
ncbi:hypothetical protein OMAG_002344 [Candidatus Omnitrophus magneticus]|uniref:Uncharacterized protein n=1 Tax=Candidatus Omnitrophus magneticus TaxID=1609969 RepID=A0A0F0CKF7_9BACT|nr:hypothetical protein OMAG_002344 [Candidatus Omnitrophus magneticus]